MLTDFEIKEMSTQLFKALSLLKRINKRIKDEKHSRRYTHLNNVPKFVKR